MASEKTKQLGIIALITGGSGFLGTSMVHEILKDSSPVPVRELRVFDLRPMKGVEDRRVKFIQGDVREGNALLEASRDVDLVIHSAAIVDWGTKSEEEIMAVNVQGTRNVIEACRENGVKAMVYTSSLDVLYDGNPLPDVDEEWPYPKKHATSYCESKYLGEKSALEANGDSLCTCSLRPADIYGEGDPYHIGSLINMAKGGFYVRLGNGRARCQHVYVGNMAHAHLLASEALLSENQQVRGQAYFITDGPASNFFTFFDRIVEAAGYRIRPKNMWLPRWFAYGLGCISEAIALLLRPIHKYSPKMSRFAVTYTCTDYTFTSEKAEKDLGFVPKYSKREAFDRTVNYFRKPDN
jgi:sterol-4alpha-carboxylate 3-dehydrogenase (decarboxylating)